MTTDTGVHYTASILILGRFNCSAGWLALLMNLLSVH